MLNFTPGLLWALWYNRDAKLRDRIRWNQGREDFGNGLDWWGWNKPLFFTAFSRNSVQKKSSNWNHGTKINP
nr:MAG TPA_asm: hypothetical protein [Caudoviricetes sp.]